MKQRGQTKCHAGLFQASPRREDIQLNAHAQSSEDIGAAAATGDGAITVLNYWHSRASYHQGRGRADVKCAAAVASGAAGVQNIVAFDGQREAIFAEYCR